MKSRNYTIRDIAKEVGVSVATVSRVMNNPECVSKDTRDRVQDAIDKFDYVPNAVAKSLFKKETYNIGVILPDISNCYYAKMYLAIQKRAQEDGYIMILCNSMNELEQESMYLELLEKQRVDGIIFMGGRTDRVKLEKRYMDEIRKYSAKAPFITINGSLKEDNVYNIMTDLHDATNKIMEHVLSNGHKKIALVGGYTYMLPIRNKLKWMQEAAQEHGAEDIVIKNYECDFNPVSGYRILTQIYKLRDLPDLIVAANDEVAIGIIHACLENNLRVPEDISIIGYDDIDLAVNSYPTLTTFRHPYAQIGDMVINSLNCLIKRQPIKNIQSIKGRLIIRQSVKK